MMSLIIFLEAREMWYVKIGGGGNVNELYKEKKEIQISELFADNASKEGNEPSGYPGIPLSSIK